MTKQEFFLLYAPQFNFELNADELIEWGLKKKFIVKLGEDQYEYKEDLR